MNTVETPVHMRWLAYGWGLSLIAVWVVVALALKQPLWAEQHSRDLVVGGHGQPKPGHLASLVFGLMVGLVYRLHAKHHPL